MAHYVACPCCHGAGGWYEPVLWKGPSGGPFESCTICKGKGSVTMKQKMDYIRAFKKPYRKAYSDPDFDLHPDWGGSNTNPYPEG